MTLILIVAGLSVLPYALLIWYRDTIPPGPMWFAVLFPLALPGLGWFVTLYVALKDWDWPPPKGQDSGG